MTDMKILLIILTLVVFPGCTQRADGATTQALMKEIQEGVVRYANKGFEQILSNTEVLTLDALNKTFQEFDWDNNGTLEYEEFTDFGFQSNRTRVATLKQKLFNTFDTDGDGKLQIYEWTAIFYDASTNNNNCHLSMAEFINFILKKFENIIADYMSEMGLTSSG